MSCSQPEPQRQAHSAHIAHHPQPSCRSNTVSTSARPRLAPNPMHTPRTMMRHVDRRCVRLDTPHTLYHWTHRLRHMAHTPSSWSQAAFQSHTGYRSSCQLLRHCPVHTSDTCRHPPNAHPLHKVGTPFHQAAEPIQMGRLCTGTGRWGSPPRRQDKVRTVCRWTQVHPAGTVHTNPRQDWVACRWDKACTWQNRW